ncbi:MULTISPECIES: ABC transporter permease [Bacillus cereus group]|uniref:Transport permease protein n=1 Tax=Bacillus proteolyticus TaxID=2026192 RepID=A0ABV3IFP0_9BACI|nr:ABC transporter permease [Bacillus cereus group sp. N8]MBJ8107563.1 ABC transporter permease [Bacillus cereus group sp. N8]
MDNIFIRFFRQSILSYKALFGFLDPKIYFLVKVINPIMQLVFFSLIARYIHHTSDITPWVIGNAFLLSIYNALFGVGTVMVSERSFGTLQLVVASTANNFLIFIGRAFIHIFDATATVIIGLTVGYLFFELDFSNTNFLLLIICIIITMFSSIGVGLLLGSMGLVSRDLNLIMNTAVFVLMIFSGAQFPISNLPLLLSKVSYYIPITRGIEASRLIIDGNITVHVFNLLGGEALIGIIYMMLGYFTLRIFEYISKKKATLDIY